MIDVDQVDRAAVDRPADVSSAVGHFCRQFSMKKKKKTTTTATMKKTAKNTHRHDSVASSSSRAFAATERTPSSDSGVDGRDGDNESGGQAEDGLSARPELTADVVHAPPWLVADHFVSEHVAHEHVSVAPEPSYADPVLPDDRVGTAGDDGLGPKAHVSSKFHSSNVCFFYSLNKNNSVSARFQINKRKNDFPSHWIMFDEPQIFDLIV